METFVTRFRNEGDTSDEVQVANEDFGPSKIIPTKAMFKQGLASYPPDQMASSTFIGRGHSGAGSSHSPPRSSQEQVTPFTSTVHPQQTCCIIEKNLRCHQYVGRYVYNKVMQKRMKPLKSLQIKADSRARHIGLCNYHKTLIDDIIWENSRGNSRKRGRGSNSRHSDDDTESNEGDETDEKFEGIDFGRFPLATLQKYKKFFSIPGQLSKGQLADIITRHFKTVPVINNQMEIVEEFISKVKNSEAKAKGRSSDS